MPSHVFPFDLPRAGDPLNGTIEINSDQPTLPIDRALAFLHGATESLKEEICLTDRETDSGKARHGNLARSFSQIDDIKGLLEKLSPLG